MAQVKTLQKTLNMEEYNVKENIWIREGMPPTWQKSDPNECSNCTGIALLEIGSPLLKHRLEQYVEKLIGKYEEALLNNFTDSYEYKISTFMLFVDFKTLLD